MTKKEIDLVIERALEKWGGEMQLDVLVEEMAELIQALVKRKRFIQKFENEQTDELDSLDFAENSENIIEEIVDIEIMLYQAKKYLEIESKIDGWKKRKLKRLAEKLEVDL